MNKTEMAVRVFNERAHQYQEKYMDVEKYKDTLDAFCKNIDIDASILDIGCGPGNITKYLLEKSSAYKITGLDLAPAMIELAKKNNPNARFQLLDCRRIETLKQKYTGIVAAFCLPYLNKNEAVNLIKDSASILDSGGILYLSTMEDNYEKSGMQTSSYGDQLFIYYHEADYLLDAIRQCDFNILDVQRIACKAPGDLSSNDLVILARKAD